VSLIGPRPNLLGIDDGGTHLRLEVDHPVLTNTDLARIRHIEDHTGGAFRTKTGSICYSVEQGIAGMRERLNAEDVEHRWSEATMRMHAAALVRVCGWGRTVD
jgi:glutamate synthase (NADPH/NADH) large chain